MNKKGKRASTWHQQNYLQMEHLQLLPSQFIISFLNWLKFDVALISSVSLFHKTGAAYLKDFFTKVGGSHSGYV